MPACPRLPGGQLAEGSLCLVVAVRGEGEKSLCSCRENLLAMRDEDAIQKE